MASLWQKNGTSIQKLRMPAGLKKGAGKALVRINKPWLTVRDVPSEGRSHRVFGHLTHHLLSDLGLETFLLLQ